MATSWCWCCRCRRYRAPEDFFPRQPEFSYCRSCRSEIAKEWRERNPEAVAAYNAARRIGPRERECVDCGASFTAGERGPAGVRCRDCRAARRAEKQRARERGEKK